MREKENIKVVVIKKPTKEQVIKKTKELSEFLEKAWFLPLNTKTK